MELKIALIGFGNVGQALARLIQAKNKELGIHYDLNISIMGIATGTRGYAIDEHGLDINRTFDAAAEGSLGTLHAGPPIPDTMTFIRKVPANVIVETSPLNAETGQPALDYVRLALQLRRHVASANKGPVAFGYHELKRIAEQNQCGFLFESTVMDGVPVFGLVRETLPLAQIKRIRAILNSTTNNILMRMESGMPFAEALREMQTAGLAETNPSYDVDGWDATVKITILANVLMGAHWTPAEVDRMGIGALTVEEVQAAVRSGKTIKLVCEAIRDGESVKASVKPVALPLDDPLAQVKGTGNLLILETDLISRLSIGEGEAAPMTTAYGLLTDIINIARGHIK